MMSEISRGSKYYKNKRAFKFLKYFWAIHSIIICLDSLNFKEYICEIMAGPTISERRGLAPQESRLDDTARKAAVSEINGLIANRTGIVLEEREKLFVGKDGFEFDGRQGPDLARITYPGISADGKPYIVRTFYRGKTFSDPSFEVVYPGDFKNPGTSTQTALDEARKLLSPPQPETQP